MNADGFRSRTHEYGKPGVVEPRDRATDGDVARERGYGRTSAEQATNATTKPSSAARSGIPVGAAIAGTNTTGDEIDRDATATTDSSTGLRAGDPRSSHSKSRRSTPVRVILGDFIGRRQSSRARPGHPGRDLLEGQLDVPGATQHVTSRHGQGWYTKGRARAAHEGYGGKESSRGWKCVALPADAFLTGSTRLTWQSEWVKYGVTWRPDDAGARTRSAGTPDSSPLIRITWPTILLRRSAKR